MSVDACRFRLASRKVQRGDVWQMGFRMVMCDRYGRGKGRLDPARGFVVLPTRLADSF